jgi:hypothetical protein
MLVVAVSMLVPITPMKRLTMTKVPTITKEGK